ncbi:hypothetical protein RintRC_0318 [Richelia intracellularis]|nr:hypothetical protein RintRC_0318 [Richelia intracellularis]
MIVKCERQRRALRAKGRWRCLPFGEVLERLRQKKLTQLGNPSLDSVLPGRGIKTLSKPNKHSYPHLALPYANQSSPVAGTLVGHKNRDLNIKEVK